MQDPPRQARCGHEREFESFWSRGHGVGLADAGSEHGRSRTRIVTPSPVAPDTSYAFDFPGAMGC
ncbi:hypothetical protein ABT115_18210 [Streptomyces sp. NPDC001832]|uniref:hypothetical protein n=1 Tax=Streptomyces sp. NPDC001832 TaxID=3154527 RepID=UPI00332DF811